MTLPNSPNRIWLLSFWLAMSLLLGLIIGVLFWTLISPGWSVLGAVFALMLALGGVMRPPAITRPYSVWNSLADHFAHFARKWVTRVCFYTVFLGVGYTGTAIETARPTSDTISFWVRRETLPPSVYAIQHKTTEAGATQRSWIFSYLSWAVGSKSNLWACFLLPFFIVLRALDVEEENSFPSNIYTLY